MKLVDAVSVATLCALVTAQCGPAVGTVLGDVFFAAADREAHRFAGVTVKILAHPDSAKAEYLQACSFALGADAERRLQFIVQGNAALSSSWLDIASQALSGGLQKEADKALARADSLHQAAKPSADTLTLLYKQMAEASAQVLREHTVLEVTTTVDGHFDADTRPGRYALYASARLRDAWLQWWADVVVTKGSATRLDLSNAMLMDRSLHCGTAPVAR